MSAAAVFLRPGFATLADWRNIYRGAPVALDPISRADVEAGAAALQAVLSREDTQGRGDDRDVGPTVVELLNKGGEPLPAAIVRLAVALKLASLGQGASGASWRLVETIESCLRHDLLPAVPAGNASDRLAFAHLASILTGAGEVASGQKRTPSSKALKKLGLAPARLTEAERRAILSGTQLSTAFALAGLFEAERVFQSGLVAGALSAHSARAADPPLHPSIARIQRHPGGIDVAAALRKLLPAGAHLARQDAPPEWGNVRRNQARMGACLDLLRQAGVTLERQANAVTERRLVLWQTEEIADAVEETSAVALASDLIAMAIREIGGMSEERIRATAERPNGSSADAGAGSTGPLAMAAGFVAENRDRAGRAGLAGEAQDEGNSAGDGVRRLLPMAGTAALVVAIEVLAAASANDDPQEARGPLKGAWELLRTSLLGPGREISVAAADLAGAAELVRSGALAAAVDIPLPSIVPSPAASSASRLGLRAKAT